MTYWVTLWQAHRYITLGAMSAEALWWLAAGIDLASFGCDIKVEWP